MNVQPILMIGPPRSGTTLLARLLACADSTLSLTEPFHMHAILHRWVLGGFFWDFQRRHGLARVKLPGNCTEKRFMRFLCEIGEANRLKHLVVKEVFKKPGLEPPFPNYEQLDRFAARGYPMIGIIRNPRDAAASTIGLLRWLLGKHRGCIIRMLWSSVPRFSNDDRIVEWAAKNWSDFADWIRTRGVPTVRYEDLVDDPATKLPWICEQIGLPFHEHMLNHHQHKPVAFGGGGDPLVLMQKARPIHKQSVGRGNNLTRRQNWIIAKACGELAGEFGYRISGASQEAS